jgi:hypothetical protein
MRPIYMPAQRSLPYHPRLNVVRTFELEGFPRPRQKNGAVKAIYTTTSNASVQNCNQGDSGKQLWISNESGNEPRKKAMLTPCSCTYTKDAGTASLKNSEEEHKS